MKQRDRVTQVWAIAIVGMMSVGGAAAAGVWLHLGTSASSTTPSVAAATSSTTSLSVKTSVRPAASFGPHPGTIQAYETVPGGATTLDPALAYDTTSYEVILNDYQTLVSYNGSTTSTMVPTLATCVPLQGTQCARDYGTGFTGVFNATGANYTGSNGEPVYWTFVLDPAARFYDPSNGNNWSVYPTDVMFSVSRTLAWSTYPYVAKTAGWILAQSLLPLGSSAWDNGTHFPYNNTPGNVLGSMLINDSRFCPTSAMNGVKGNGCITFIANGTGQVWPEFEQFVADNLGGSVVPCGWFMHESAGLPGWSNSTNTSGDGPCTLPGGGNSTATSAWTTYLATVTGTPYAWDGLILANGNWPATQPNVQWNMVGSGPYYASVSPHLSYSLASNPAYAEPSGCSGAGGLAVYSGYCDPAPGKYIPNVQVTWETSAEGDSLGVDAIQAGSADLAGIYTTQTSTLLGFVASGDWQYLLFPTLSTAFTPINLGVSYSAYNTSFAGTPLHNNPLPPNLLTDFALRNFYVNSYPYTTIENTVNTVDGIHYAFNAGGPIPVGMGNYYPGNVSWPYLRGDPTQSATTPSSAAWWWSQLTTPSSPYYNQTVATQCTTASPCTWPIGYFNGAPANLVIINDWAGEIYNLSGHTLQPWPLAESFNQFLLSLAGAYQSPVQSAVGFGWAPDYPDPTDYIAPMAQPDGSYTGPDAFSEQLCNGRYMAASCGHNGTSNLSNAFANLTYWAGQADALNTTGTSALTSACQGIAYNIASYWMAYAGTIPTSAARILDYNLIEKILNALAMYVYNGQSNELVGFAPWIDPSSINQNPVIGGGGDMVWFQTRYQSLYTATVSQTGLPAGTAWTVHIGPRAGTSTSSSLTFDNLPNGTYPYTVTAPTGYTANVTSGNLLISGNNEVFALTFSGSGPAASPAWTYLSPLAYALIGVLAVLVVLGFVLAARKGGGGAAKKPPESWTGEETTPTETGPGGTSGPPPGKT